MMVWRLKVHLRGISYMGVGYMEEIKGSAKRDETSVSIWRL